MSFLTGFASSFCAIGWLYHSLVGSLINRRGTNPGLLLAMSQCAQFFVLISFQELLNLLVFEVQKLELRVSLGRVSCNCTAGTSRVTIIYLIGIIKLTHNAFFTS